MSFNGFNNWEKVLLEMMEPHFEPWKEKFAIMPTKVEGQWLWLKPYYKRKGYLFPSMRKICEKATLLGMLKRQ